MLDPQNMGIDTKIMPLSYLGPEIMLKTCSEWRPFWNPRWRPKTQITAWQTTYHGSGGPNEYCNTICQLLPKMFSGTFILSFCPLTTAELAASRKEEKYADLDGCYTFEPIAIETLGVFNTSARQLLCDLGRKISENTGKVRETSFLFQRCSVLVQRFNAILLHDSLPAYDCTDWFFVPIFVFFQ